MKIDIAKLAKTGIEVKQDDFHQINFKNLQRFVDHELSNEEYRSQYNATFTYAPKTDKWFGNNAFNKTEKAEMIQAILAYEPSDDEIKEIPLEVVEMKNPFAGLSIEEINRNIYNDNEGDLNNQYF